MYKDFGKISVVVPVYNKEKYIEQCIESILSQTYENIELILVDDGSTDQSNVICDKYMEKDSRVISIHQKNMGQSIARNTGIDIATGDWFIAPDSDDWLDSNYLQDLIEVAGSNCLDCVIGNCKRIVIYDGIVKETEERKAFDKEFITDSNDVIFFVQANSCAARINHFDKRIEKDDIVGLRSVATPWDKLYNLKIINKSNLRYIPNLGSREDIIFSLNYLDKCSKIGYIHTFGYNYRVLADSISHGFKKDIVDGDRNTYIEFGKWINMCTDTRRMDYVKQGIYVATIRMFLDDCERWFFNNENLLDSDIKSAILQERLEDNMLKMALDGVIEKNMSEKELLFIDEVKSRLIFDHI